VRFPGREVVRRTPVGGGSINDAARVELDDGTVAFVKTRPGAPAGEYAAEAEGLAWLGAAGGLAVPQVLSVGADHLALRWVDEGSVDPDALGRALAVTHRAGAEGFGWPHPVRFGALELSNEPAPDWAAFHAERRLRPLARMAADRGALGARGAAAVDRVCGRLGELLGPPEPPARLHGDLWSGNVLGQGPGAAPVVVDPAAHGGHREVDLAMLRLFGDPGPRLLAAYHEVFPLAEGHEDRVALHQLTPLLVHAVLFGGGYGAAAERVAARYA
jgi:fructosamine-3-kinase